MAKIMRVGITTILEKRKKEWMRKYPQIKNWKVIATNLTKKQAVQIEEEYIKKGYQGPPDSWNVYTFEIEDIDNNNISLK